MGIPDHLTCLSRNLYAGQEATVRTGHGTTDWFQIGKGIHQGNYSKLLKILQARLQQYVNCEIPAVQAGLEKAEEPEIKLPTSVGPQKKQENSTKQLPNAGREQQAPRKAAHCLLKEKLFRPEGNGKTYLK